IRRPPAPATSPTCAAVVSVPAPISIRSPKARDKMEMLSSGRGELRGTSTMPTPARSRAAQIDSTSGGRTPRKMATNGLRVSQALTSNRAYSQWRPARVPPHLPLQELPRHRRLLWLAHKGRKAAQRLPTRHELREAWSREPRARSIDLTNMRRTPLHGSAPSRLECARQTDDATDHRNRPSASLLHEMQIRRWPLR